MSQGVGQERKNERGRKKKKTGGIGREKEEGGERWGQGGRVVTGGALQEND